MKLDKTAKLIDVNRQNNMQYQVFRALKAHADLAKKGAVLTRIREVTLAVKAF